MNTTTLKNDAAPADIESTGRHRTLALEQRVAGFQGLSILTGYKLEDNVDWLISRLQFKTGLKPYLAIRCVLKALLKMHQLSFGNGYPEFRDTSKFHKGARTTSHKEIRKILESLGYTFSNRRVWEALSNLEEAGYIWRSHGIGVDKKNHIFVRLQVDVLVRILSEKPGFSTSPYKLELVRFPIRDLKGLVVDNQGLKSLSVFVLQNGAGDPFFNYNSNTFIHASSFSREADNCLACVQDVGDSALVEYEAGKAGNSFCAKDPEAKPKRGRPKKQIWFNNVDPEGNVEFLLPPSHIKILKHLQSSGLFVDGGPARPPVDKVFAEDVWRMVNLADSHILYSSVIQKYKNALDGGWEGMVDDPANARWLNLSLSQFLMEGKYIAQKLKRAQAEAVIESLKINGDEEVDFKKLYDELIQESRHQFDLTDMTSRSNIEINLLHPDALDRRTAANFMLCDFNNVSPELAIEIRDTNRNAARIWFSQNPAYYLACKEAGHDMQVLLHMPDENLIMQRLDRQLFARMSQLAKAKHTLCQN